MGGSMARRVQQAEVVTSGRLEENPLRTRRAIRVMVSIGLCFIAVGVALLTAEASPYGRAIGIVLVVWGIGTFRRERSPISSMPEWK
jgi:hypothetical protein